MSDSNNSPLPPRAVAAHTLGPVDLERRAALGKLSGLIALPVVVSACGGSGNADPAVASQEAAAPAPTPAAPPAPPAGTPASPPPAPIAVAAKEHKLWYAAAATDWESEALPIGNARLGAMLFGGIAKERIQFNEQSLWGGVNNHDGNYDTGLTGFGSYLDFGELSLQFGAQPTAAPIITSPSGQSLVPSDEDILKSIDGDTNTKWCIPNPGALVVWQVDLQVAAIASSYSLISANDVPERDPQVWVLSGSNNGSTWMTLDSRALTAPFESRFLTRSFTFSNGVAYRYYRFAFTPKTGVSHFQVAGIGLGGIDLNGSANAVLYVSSPSADDFGNGNTAPDQDIFRTVDGDIASKWCVLSPGNPVTWQVDLGNGRVLGSYALTSAADSPESDPKTFVLEGSADGAAWSLLDTRTLAAPFETRGQTKTYTFSNRSAYRYYRLGFTPRTGANQLQLAEISLSGPGFSTAGKTFVAAYRRELNLAQALHTTRFIQGGITVTREAFASHVDDVLVLRYSASRTGSLSGSLTLASAQSGAVSGSVGDQLSFSGVLPNNLKYAAGVRLLHVGGSVATNSAAITFNGCDELVVLLDARTDYKPSYADGWRGSEPVAAVNAALASAAAKPYASLRSAHMADFSALVSTVSIDWGSSTAATRLLPTDLRLSRYAGNAADPELEQSMFSYGRYLLASCSRPGGLPANLQGLWNNSNSPAWASDYHNNINVQMNYWGAESTALSACHLPLVDFVEAALVPCRAATKRAFGSSVRGWTARTSQSIFGGNGWDWNNVASAWYAQHLYEHYAFTQDKTYLRRVYPMIKEVCQFWQDRLKKRADGLLVSPNGWSPEHGPTEDGVMYDQQLIWDLFQNYLDAAKALGVDSDYQGVISGLQTALAPNKIGRWGQLQEWQEDNDDADDLHRHTSHLFAVFPGRQITQRKSPVLAAAAMVSLKARCNEKTGVAFTAATVSGDSRRSWTWPWRAALFARLGDGARAGAMVRGLLSYNTLSNLFCNHPPFQMDGNFGITGAVAEMLLQSHDGEISLLPACPPDWAAGSFAGLRARGGYKVSCTWSAGQVTAYSITADRAATQDAVKVRFNGAVVQVVPTAA